jgi:ATP-dependent Clp protease ATP-binding subunit ClpC
MWNRFTELARRIVLHSQEVAFLWGHGEVTTKHLLLGIVREGKESVVARILEQLGVTLGRLKVTVESQMIHGDSKPKKEIKLAADAKKTIDLAFEEAKELNCSYIGTEHLLLGLLKEPKSEAAEILASLGVDLQNARDATKRIQNLG